MTSIDPRLADRRKEVAEDRARRNIKRLLRLMIFLGTIGLVVWLFLSPTLSADEIDIAGVGSSRAGEILEEELVVMGRPLILIRAGSIEERLLADPWIKSADVDIDWPNRVAVTIEERSPVAWVETAGGWARRAVDGVALPGTDVPDDTMAHVMLPGVSDSDIYESFELTGSLEFVAALPVSMSSNAVLEERSGELWAIVSGFEVRLGRPVEMKAKALTLATLLQENLPPGAEINLIAPTNPAVSAPGNG
jgi:cell division protein FtsQ